VVTGRPADCVYASGYGRSEAGGEPTQRSEWTAGFIGGLAWTPDGREILFAQPEMSGTQIVRVTASGTESPVAVAATPHESLGPSVSRSRGGQYYRLAFFSGQPDVALRMIDLASDRRAGAMTAVHAFLRRRRVWICEVFPDRNQRAFKARRSRLFVMTQSKL
jgi:hypothetical protein